MSVSLAIVALMPAAQAATAHATPAVAAPGEPIALVFHVPSSGPVEAGVQEPVTCTLEPAAGDAMAETTFSVPAPLVPAADGRGAPSGGGGSESSLAGGSAGRSVVQTTLATAALAAMVLHFNKPPGAKP